MRRQQPRGFPGDLRRAALPGRIINIASTSGTRAFPPIIATSIAKTALIRFSEGLAAQLRDRGIHVFAVHPGVVRTRLLESYGLTLREEWSVAPERAGTLCVQLASGVRRNRWRRLACLSRKNIVLCSATLRARSRSPESRRDVRSVVETGHVIPMPRETFAATKSTNLAEDMNRRRLLPEGPLGTRDARSCLKEDHVGLMRGGVTRDWPLLRWFTGGTCSEFEQDDWTNIARPRGQSLIRD